MNLQHPRRAASLLVLIVAALACVLSCPGWSRADIPSPDGRPRIRRRPPLVRPDPRPADQPVETQLILSAADDVKQPRLRLPRKVLAGLTGGGAAGEGAGAAPGPRSAGDPGPPRVVVIGLALSAAAVSGGLWLTRRRSAGQSTRLPLVLLAACGMAGVGMLAWADVAAPPSEERPRPPEAKEPPKNLSDLKDQGPQKVQFLLSAKMAVTVEVTDDGDTVQLVVDRATLRQLAEAPPPPAPGTPAGK